MTARKAHHDLPPPRRRGLSREEAAAYVGLSPNAFEVEVRAGTFPGPFLLRRIRRSLWDVKALDAAMDRAGGLEGANDDWEADKRAWKARRQGRSESAR